MNAELFNGTTTRDPLDFNRTPAWCVELLIPHLGKPQTILDAGCGDGAIGEVLRWQLRDTRPQIVGVEIDAHRATLSALKVDTRLGGYMVYDIVRRKSIMECTLIVGGVRPDLIISNPPFGLPALEFLRRALERVRPGGTVAFLLPTHWDHDPDAKTDFARQRFLDSIRLPDGREGYAKLAIVGGGPNPCRPSFRGGSSTATDRYAWFMFGEQWAGQPSRRLHAIPPAVTAEQRALL